MLDGVINIFGLNMLKWSFDTNHISSSEFNVASMLVQFAAITTIIIKEEDEKKKKKKQEKETKT